MKEVRLSVARTVPPGTIGSAVGTEDRVSVMAMVLMGSLELATWISNLALPPEFWICLKSTLPQDPTWEPFTASATPSTAPSQTIPCMEPPWTTVAVPSTVRPDSASSVEGIVGMVVLQ